jgi:preprotein translocase subunit SecE
VFGTAGGGSAQRVTNHPRDTEEGEVAQSKRRRGKDADDEDLDKVLDDAVDEDVDDVDDEADLDDDEDTEDEDESVATRRGGTATKVKKASVDTDKLTRVKSEDRVGIFGRLLRFFREVVAELRKVIWPTRKELLTYATVVIIFVAFIVTIVALLDTGFAWAVLKVFGGGGKSK